VSARHPTVRELLEARAETGLAARSAVEDTFFRRLTLPGFGTKRTARGRLAEVDAALLPWLPRGGVLELHDVAISSGVTSLDWLEAVRASGRGCRLLATDRELTAWRVRCGRHLEVLLDRQGQALQFDLAGRGWPARARGWKGVFPAGARLLLRVALAVDRRWPERADEVPLVVSELAARRDVELREEDLWRRPLAGLEGRFDAVRAANLLNPDLFPEPVLRTLVGRLWARVKPGGLCVLVRTIGSGDHAGTIFRRGEGGAVEVLARIGAGSELEALVRSLDPTRTGQA
jgi:hypothetical protein